MVEKRWVEDAARTAYRLAKMIVQEGRVDPERHFMCGDLGRFRGDVGESCQWAVEKLSDLVRLRDSPEYNDKLQIRTLLRKTARLNERLGAIQRIVADVAGMSFLDIPSPLVLWLQDVGHKLVGDIGLLVSSTGETNFQFEWTPLMEGEPGEKVPQVGQYCVMRFPASQANDPFMSVILFHELGHCYFLVRDVFQAAVQGVPKSRRDEWQREVVALADRLRSKYNLPHGPGSQDPILARLGEIVYHWTAELFCDSFALRVAGPAYLYASYMFHAGRDISLQADWSPDHPPFAVRLQYLWDSAEKLSWLDALRRVPAVAQWMEASRSEELRFPQPVQDEAVVELTSEAFRYVKELWHHVLPQVLSLPESLCPGPDGLDHVSKAARAALKDYQLPYAHPAQDFRPCADNPMLIVNAALEYVLTDMSSAWGRRFRKDKPSLDDEAEFQQKACELTLKALEDALIVQEWQRPHNGSSDKART